MSTTQSGTNQAPDNKSFNNRSSDFEGSKDSLQGRILEQVRNLGDMLERAGEKIEQSGYQRIGEAIYNLGDRLEHLKSKSASGGSSSSAKTGSVSTGGTFKDGSVSFDANDTKQKGKDSVMANTQSNQQQMDNKNKSQDNKNLGGSQSNPSTTPSTNPGVSKNNDNKSSSSTTSTKQQ